MEDNSNHDSVSESTNEAENHVESGEMSEKNPESDNNNVDRKPDDAADESESSEEHEGQMNDKKGEKEESVKGESTAAPEYDDQVCESSSTPAANIPSTDFINSCPVPPTRQRRKSRTGSDTARAEEEETQEEKSHGGRRESEGQEKEEKEEDGKKREESDLTSKEKVKANPHNEDKMMKEKCNEDAHTNVQKTIPTPTRRNRKREKKPNQEEATQPVTGDKHFNLEEGKNEMEDDKKKKKMEDEEGERESLVGMKKELGLVNCVGIIVGNIIGTGIFISPGAVLQYTGSVGVSLIVWIVSGLAAIVGALCYAELGTMIPQSGGNYTYLHEAFGPLPAFLYVWMIVMVSIPGARAVVALSFASYVTQPFFPDDAKAPDAALKMIGILLIVTLTYINCQRVRWVTTVQDSLALAKVLALIMIIVVGLFHLSRGTTENYDNPMEGTSTNPALIATAFYHTLFAYDGWDSLNGIMEELKDPFRNMPRAIAISVITVMVIYVLTNVAYFAVLPKDLMLASPAVAVTFGNLALGVMAWTIPIFVACSITGGLNGSILLSSRLIFVSSRRGQLPRALSLVHVNNSTPVTALVFMACISMVMFVTSDVRVLINYMGFAVSLMNLICIGSFFWFRVKNPELARPIKVWIGFPIIYVVLSFCLCVFPVVQQPLQVLAAVLILGSGVPVYYLLVNKQNRPQRLATAMDKVTYVCQVLFMAAPEERPT